jgi:hypothetical protein
MVLPHKLRVPGIEIGVTRPRNHNEIKGDITYRLQSKERKKMPRGVEATTVFVVVLYIVVALSVAADSVTNFSLVCRHTSDLRSQLHLPLSPVASVVDGSIAATSSFL